MNLMALYQFDLPMIGSSDDLELVLDIVDKVGLQPFDGKLLGGNDNNVCGAICWFNVKLGEVGLGLPPLLFSSNGFFKSHIFSN